MIKFLHTADWHIRDVQYGRSFRGEDYRKAVREVVEIAINSKVDFILNGGDTLHINRPSSAMLDFLFEIHSALYAAGIPMFTITGNHDAADPSFLSFPEKTNPNPGLGGIICIDNQEISYKGLRIAGFPAIPFRPAPDKEGNVVLDPNGDTLLESLGRLKEKPDIVLWHGAIEEFVPFPMRNSGSMHDLPKDLAHAWLLGDIHLRGRQRLESGAIVSYPGPVEMCERGESATKFVDYYELDGDWRSAPFPEPTEIELDTRPVIFLTVGDDAEADQAVGKIRKSINENPGRSPLIFARYEKSQKGFVSRVLDMIDPRDTVFRAASFSSTFLNKFSMERTASRPSLMEVVKDVVPPGTPLHELSCQLVTLILQNEERLLRNTIVTWVESSVDKAREAAATETTA